MLADALDDTLSAADKATFDLHMAACASCAGMLNDARRGLAWMEMLKAAQPEPPATLLDRIFAQTYGAQTSVKTVHTSPAVDHRRTPNTLLNRPVLANDPSIQPAAAFAASDVLPFRVRFTQGLRSIGQTMLQPRLAMTAAMAFFSIALTMNLTGVRLSSLRASDFKPSSIQRAYSNTKARVVRYSDNLRVVYELESRVRDLQRSDSDFSPTPAPQNAPAASSPQKTPSGDHEQPDEQKPGSQNPNQKQTRPKPGPGSSRREIPGGNLLRIDSMHRRGVQSASLQPFVVLLPSVFLPIKDEGGLA